MPMAASAMSHSTPPWRVPIGLAWRGPASNETPALHHPDEIERFRHRGLLVTIKIIVTCFRVKSPGILRDMAKRYNQSCPVAKTLEVIGDRWTLLVVRDLLRGTQRFQDLLDSLPGIAPNILSARLKLMEEHGLIRRALYSDHPPRAEYALTDRGRELGMVVGALAAWGGRHVHRETQ